MKTKARGLLTIVVTARQARRAVDAAFGRRTYRRGSLIYRDDSNAWFEPVGTLVMASGPRESEPDEQTPKGVIVGVKELVKGVKEKLGWTDSPELRRYRECRKLIDTEPEVREQMRAVNAALDRARKAAEAGVPTIDGKTAVHRVAELAHEQHVVGLKLQAVNSARVEAVGLCPDADLQKQRRDLTTARKRTIALLGEIDRHIAEERWRVEQLRKNLDGLTDKAEKATAQRKLTQAEQTLNDLSAERADHEAERLRLDAEREELAEKMRHVDA